MEEVILIEDLRNIICKYFLNYNDIINIHLAFKISINMECTNILNNLLKTKFSILNKNTSEIEIKKSKLSKKYKELFEYAETLKKAAYASIKLSKTENNYYYHNNMNNDEGDYEYLYEYEINKLAESYDEIFRQKFQNNNY